MEIKISLDEMRKRKIAVMTPMYGGQCFGWYSRSCSHLSAFAAAHGIDVRLMYLFNESLVQRARNYLIDEFLRSDCTHAMFIDSDIGFEPNDVIALAALAEPGSEYQIVCGPYPKKSINWTRIKAAVDQGIADENPAVLDKMVGDYVFNTNAKEIPVNEPFEVSEAGTGFMMIQREALEKWRDAYPDQAYTPDHTNSEAFSGDRKITAFFDCVIDPETNRYLSEDYYFCRKAGEIGIKTWMVPMIKLTHTGTYTYQGDMSSVGQVR